MTLRFRDALAIQEGACNPHGITRSLLNALDECRAENKDTAGCTSDPAVRLIVHQLAFIVNVAEIDDGLTEYQRLIEACEATLQY